MGATAKGAKSLIFSRAARFPTEAFGGRGNMQHQSERIWSDFIVSDNGVTSRCFRKWRASGRFPAPDGNLNGRNYWLRTTYEAWKTDVAAGKYSQQRRPGAVALGSQKDAA